MKYLGSNINHDDCVIIALFNVSKAYGKKNTYSKIYDLALSRGWYEPGKGFYCKYLDDAFAALNLKARLLPDNACLKKIFKNVVKKKKVYVFFRPSDWAEIPGHAMVAIKGERGVKVHNAYDSGAGWRTLAKSIKNGKKHFMIEITR